MPLLSGSSRIAAAAIAAVIAVALSACGSGSSDDASVPDDSTVVPVSAFEFGYELDAPEAPGTYTFELTNDGAMQHDLVLEGDADGATGIVSPGDSDSFTVTLEPGDYTLYCSITGHRGQGMEVSFTIE